MFFSPTTARSLPVRSLFAGIYIILILGGITMIFPFLIMITGSVEPRSQNDRIDIFPPYLLNENALWSRYIETKYIGTSSYYRMAWNDPTGSFLHVPPITKPVAESPDVSLWNEFLSSQDLSEKLFSVGFLRPDKRMPAFTNFAFRDWLVEKYGSLAGINRSLDASFQSVAKIESPQARMDGSILPDTSLVRAFLEFSATQPQDRKFAWNVGGYYRTNVLPRLVDSDISVYNQRFGTSYASYAEIPFPATVPEIGAEPWFFFVSRILRTDFVQLTPMGQEHLASLELAKAEFIRTLAKPEDVLVVSADTLFAQWAAERGVSNALIPQESLDRAAFAKEKSFWRNQFLTLNYRLVLDEILGHGGAIRNTLILVILSVAGALFINPLAAYALSRYKMKSSYHILLFCLATIAFPAEVTMIPVFLQLKEFHLLNTFGALVLPGLANGFSIFLLKGFFDSLPRELYEAADLDGASEFTTFWTITMNLSKPILAVIALQAFVVAYGTFFFALILAPDPKMWTIMVYVYQLRAQVGSPVVYASLIITALPTLIVFITCQNIILRGIVVPSDK
jgi:multiple sugar transport system permease protein